MPRRRKREGNWRPYRGGLVCMHTDDDTKNRDEWCRAPAVLFDPTYSDIWVYALCHEHALLHKHDGVNA